MKKKLLISINSDLYIRNYIDTGCFEDLNKKYDCYFIGSNNDLFNKSKFKNKIKKQKFLGFISYNSYEINLFHKYLYKNFLLNKNNSKTIFFLTKLRLKFKYYWEGESIFKSILMFLPRYYSFLKKNISYFYLKILKKNFFNSSINLKLKSIFIKINPDLVIFPMQDSHILSFDLIRLSKKSKSLALIDNWDNLSSRGTYSIKPDYISVWGKQTKKHAIKYHSYNSQKIFLAGTPRFEEYFKLRNKKIKSNFPFRYILFLESFGNYNNTEFLDELDNIIKRNKIWKDLKIIYRPHPWQKKNNFKINENNYKNLIIDPQIYKHYRAGKNSTKFQPSIKYYPSLLKNSELIVTGPTSMLIESTIFYKKTLLLGYKNNSETSYFDELNNYDHLKGVEYLNNIVVCRDLKNLNNDFNKLINKKINKSKIDSMRNYFLYSSSRKYSKNLKYIVDKVIND